MSFSTATIGEENPWVSAPAAPSKRDSRRGLLAPVAPAVAARRKPRLLYAMVAVGAVVAIVCVQLALSITVSQRAFQLTSLQDKQTELGRSLQASSETVQKLSSPQNLASNANALGMVANGTPVYLRLSNGKVVGAPTPASASTASVTGHSGNLVPDALLKGVSLVSGGSGADASATKASKGSKPATKSPVSNPATPDANAQQQPTGPVVWSGQLPAPDTH